jgi:parallel beta-helix repeat protein
MKGVKISRKLAILMVMASLVGLIMLPGAAVATGLVHNLNKHTTYSAIQPAIDDANPGDKINIDSGEYRENLNANKENLVLKCVNTGSGQPIINASGIGSTITILANGVTINGCAVTGAAQDFYNSNIKAYSVNNKLTNNTVTSGYIGIYLLNSDGNQLSANNVSNATHYGIYLYNSDNNQLSGNNASLNGQSGIYLYTSSNNSLTGNIAVSNTVFGIMLSSFSNFNTINGNIVKLSRNGGIYLSRSDHNSITGNYANLNDYFGIYLELSSNNTVNGNDASSNTGSSISVTSGSYNNIVRGNNASMNGFAGISLGVNSNNELTDNDVSGNGRYGIFMSSANNNTIKWNRVIKNKEEGFIMDVSSNNTIVENNVSSGTNGMTLYSSSNNMISGNNITNNTYGIRLFNPSKNNNVFNNVLNNTNNLVFFGVTDGTWNTTKQLSVNIIGGPNLGGNFWGNPSGTGYSQTCMDVDRDGICDLTYALSIDNIDYLPLAVNDTTAPASVTNLINISYASDHINWTWTDPATADFAAVRVYLNGIFKIDVPKGMQYYDAMVTPGTYTIGTRTVDTNSNINSSWVNHTATTLLPATRYINGTVTDNATGMVMPGVKVVLNTGSSKITDANGNYSFAVSEGNYNVIVNLNLITYYVYNETVSTIGIVEAKLDIKMMLKPTGSITGSVRVK